MAERKTGIIGIDLGTTNSCVAVLEDGRPVVIESAEGDRTTPSVVCLPEDGERAVGAAARSQAVLSPERTVASVKRFMGRRMSEVTAEAAQASYNVVGEPEEPVRIEIGDRRYAPEEISAMILEKLKADAEERLGVEIERAVITVPAYFNDAQRQATKQAAQIAGLEVLRLVNEPTAAALAYGFNSDREEKLLVFDLGGGTFDVSVLEIGDGVFEVLATAGDNHLGGDDFDRAIVEHLIERFKAENGVDLRTAVPDKTQQAAVMKRLFEAAERAKIELSAMPRALISLPFIAGPEHLEMTLTRSELNELCADLLERLIAPAERALRAAGLRAEDIDHVLLVGGMTRMPAVQDKVRELTGRDPHKDVNPDEAVALGAAIQAGILAGEIEEVLLVDVTPLSLGIETQGGLVSKLIPANTTIPTQATEIFTTGQDNQSSVAVHVVQGERELASECRSLGRVQLLGIPPAQAGVPQIEVTFAIDADGILDVTAQDLGTGNTQETRIEASSGLTEEDVERMRTEAEAAREADRAKRREIEARNAAESAALAARQTLERHSQRMTDAERERITQLMTEVDELLAAPELDLELLAAAKVDLLNATQEFSQRLYQGGGEAEREEILEALAPDEEQADDSWDEPIGIEIADEGDEAEPAAEPEQPQD